MAIIRPFQALRPAKAVADKVAALPYDVYNREEAREQVKNDRYSFLRIDRPETQFPEDQDMYAACVYEKADEMIRSMEAEGVFLQDQKACYYLYELTMDGRAQTGLVACSSVDDYIGGIVKKHENTRKEKEEDRIRHVDTCSAQTGPIFLAYRAKAEVQAMFRKLKKQAPEVDFTSEDGIRHRVWVVSEDETIAKITEAFAQMDHTYIADGHHRAASAVAVSMKRRAKKPDYTGEEEFNYFLSVLFPDEELMILDYNRVMKDLSGKTPEEMLEALKEKFVVEAAPEAPYHPEKKGNMGYYMQGTWYKLTVRPEFCASDPVGTLDVAYLQREVLEPIWNIQDPKTDKRIDFVGGIRGLKELERRCEKDCAAAFSMYPTSIGELFAVADADLLMPPKSTWFEPKLRSGLFIHKIER